MSLESKSPVTEASPTTAISEHDRLQLVLDAWKHCVSVQMHFNDICMKIRNLYFTILAAAIALIGAVQDKEVTIEPLGISLHLVLFVFLSIIPISALFYFMDRHWYHRLLLGAVGHCGTIEKTYASTLPEIQLGAAIKDISPVSFAGWWRMVFFFVRDKKFQEGVPSQSDPTKKLYNLHSDQKLELVYKSVMLVALGTAILYGLFNGVEFGNRSVPALIFGNVQPATEPIREQEQAGSQTVGAPSANAPTDRMTTSNQNDDSSGQATAAPRDQAPSETFASPVQPSASPSVGEQSPSHQAPAAPITHPQPKETTTEGEQSNNEK